MFTIRQCTMCDNPLSVTSRSKGRCFSCFKKSVQKAEIPCVTCGTLFIPIRKGSSYCTLDCFNKARISKARHNPPPAPIPDCVWVPLTQNKFALIDADDAERTLSHTWCSAKIRMNQRGQNLFYAKNTRTNEYLHRFILGVMDDKTEVDHFDGDGLNCRKSNLRRTDKHGNTSNRLVGVGKASGYKGVHATSKGSWIVRYVRYGQEFSGGTFINKDEAAREYDKIIRQYGDHMATYNFPKVGERSAITGEIIK